MTDSSSATHFKGWAIPGPCAPGGLAPEPGETLDALCGYFRIFQYSDGHRFSTDDLLAAWYGTSHVPSAHRVLDLGSGIGSVGMIAAWRLPGARFVTIEAQEISVRLARKSARYNGLENRYEIRQGDLRDPAVLGADELFDLVLSSPPYFPPGSGVQAEHPQKAACRFELRGTVADYAKTASVHLAPGGVFAGVFPAAERARLERGVREAGLALVRTRDIVLREGDAPLLLVFLAMRAQDLPESARDLAWREPPLVIRRKDGSVHPEYSAVKLSVGFPP